MSLKRLSRRTLLTVGGLGLAATSVVAFAASASAVVPQPAAIGSGRIQLCAQGNYNAFFVYQDAIAGTKSSTVVKKGSCQTFEMPFQNLAQDPSPEIDIQVEGEFNTSANDFLIGALKNLVNPNTSPGIKVGAEGTTANGGAGASLKIFANN
jgi:hypothetical protein